MPDSHPEEVFLLYSLHRFEALADVSGAEAAVLRGLGDTPVRQRRGTTFRRQGDETRGVYLMIEGWVSSSLILPNGKRLIQKLHLPGDILGTPSMVLTSSADTLTAVTEAVTAYVPETNMARLFATQPRLSALFLMAVQIERLTLMDMLATKGNSSASEQLAMLFLDLHARLAPIGLVEDDGFELPVTQEILGDLLGLTAVHVNRTLRALEDQGFVARNGHRLRLLDIPGLKRLSPMPQRRYQFAPGWLPPVA